MVENWWPIIPLNDTDTARKDGLGRVWVVSNGREPPIYDEDGYQIVAVVSVDGKRWKQI